MASKQISAAEALKAFKGKRITVQVAKKVEKEVDGQKRKVFETSDVPLAEVHVTGAREYADGRVVVTTLDGQKHEAQAVTA